MYRVQFRLNIDGFFAHLPNPSVVCGIARRHRVRDSDRDTRTQRGRVAADTSEQILFADVFLSHIVFVFNFRESFPFNFFLLSLQHGLHYM